MASMMDYSKSSMPLLVSAFLAAGITGGTTYAFGLYGQALKEELHLTQAQLDTISSASFCAGVASWIPGLFVDKCGEKCAMVSGGLLGASALMSFWAIARKFISINEDGIVPILSLCGVLMFMGSALVTGSVFKLIVSNTLPTNKGGAVGVAKGFVGLGSGAFSVLFEALNRKTDLDFLPLAAFFFLAACTLPAMLFLPGKGDCQRMDVSTPAHYSSLYLGLVAMAVLVAGQAFLELLEGDEERNNQREGPDYLMAALVPCVWFGPILGLFLLPTATHAVLPSDFQDEDDDSPLTLIEKGSTSYKDDPELEENDNEELDEMDEIPEAAPSDKPQDRNLAQMLTTIPAWLMLWICTIAVGGGTVMTNNMGQMVVALRFDHKVTPAALSIFSVAQSFARVISGSLSSMVKRRTSFLIIASILGALAHTILAIASDETPFIAGVFVSGLAFGMVWPLMVLITGELFGIENVGANYMFYDGVTSALGTLALSKFVAQKVYEDGIEPGGDGVTCYGQECFQMTNWIIVGLAITGIVTSWCMECCQLTRQVYS